MLKAAQEDPKFQHFLAKLFGPKVQGTDGPITVTGHLWRGNVYVTDVTELPKPPPIRSLRSF